MTAVRSIGILVPYLTYTLTARGLLDAGVVKGGIQASEALDSPVGRGPRSARC
ncbi:hypothetical protein ACN24M_37745 [Streptomyces microflavus]|uniref:hypothetical protein n=1 Tax=Streptomyces microflavus TaxID=1919 RepID=UPI003B225A2D